MSKLKLLSVITSTAFLLNACTTVGPNYQEPNADIQAAWNSDNNGVETTEMHNEKWWESFNDPVLNSLIEQGYEHNLSLQITGVSVLEARAVLAQSVGYLYPQEQGISASYQHEDLGDNNQFDGEVPSSYEVASASIGASWEIDFWGKYRRAIRADNAAFLSSVEAYKNALVSLTAEIGSNYINIRSYQAQLKVTQKSIKAYQVSLATTQASYEAGQASFQEVQQARAALSEAQASLPKINIALQQEKDALAVLLGTTPDQVDGLVEPGNAQIPLAPKTVAVGIPKDVLRQRPDVQQAQLQAMAESEGIGAIKAQLYPALSLNGSFGYSSSDVNESSTSDIFQWSNHTVSIGPSLYLPLFNYGQVTNQVRQQDAQFQEAIFNYQNIVLTAQQEVQDGIVSYVESENSLNAMQQANDAALLGLHLELVRYQNGEIALNTLLSDIQQQLNVQLSLIDAQSKVPQGLISLYRALGGGWQIQGDNDVVSDQVKEEMTKRTDWGALLDTPAHVVTENELETEETNKLKPSLTPIF